MTESKRAFTLLEVVIGLILMASLVASAVVAISAQRKALRNARHQQQASQVAEILLTNWYDLSGSVPVRGQGAVSIQGDWLWRTYPIDQRIVCGLPVTIVRLEVVAATEGKFESTGVVSVELLSNRLAGANP